MNVLSIFLIALFEWEKKKKERGKRRGYYFSFHDQPTHFEIFPQLLLLGTKI